MPPRTPSSQQYMSYQLPEDMPEWRDRAIAASPWGGKMYGMGNADPNMPITSPENQDSNHIEDMAPQGPQFRQHNPGFVPSWDADNVSVPSSLADTLRGGMPSDKEYASALAMMLLRQKMGGGI